MADAKGRARMRRRRGMILALMAATRNPSSGGSAPVAPTNTVAPAVTGNAVLGQTLTTTDGTWTGDATITFSYQWKRGVTNIGANQNTYVVVAADEGQNITCVVTGTNGAGSSTGTSNTVAIFLDTSLFASSEKGFILDPSLLANMFQLSNGTTAVSADADPVGYILDKTANAHALIQATAGNRPLYKTSAGLHWLLWDGVNDQLTKAACDVTNNISYLTLFVAADATSEATVRSLFTFQTAGGTQRAILHLTSSGFIRVGGRRLDADGNVNVDGSVDRDGVPAIYVAEYDYANADAFGRFSQTTDASNTSFQTAGSTTAGSGIVEFGSRQNADFFDGKIFYAIAIARALTAGEKANLGLKLQAMSGATW